MIYRLAGPLSCPRGSELSFAHSHGTVPPSASLPPPLSLSCRLYSLSISQSFSLFPSFAITFASHIHRTSRLYPFPSSSLSPYQYVPLRSSTYHFRTTGDYRSIYPMEHLLYFVYSSKCKRQPASCKRTTFLLACFPRGCSCSRSFRLLRAAMFVSLSFSLFAICQRDQFDVTIACFNFLKTGNNYLV